MSVEFGLLGTIEARANGLPVEVGHTRQRCVLAALLVDANRPVSVDELIDRVWGDRAPQRARGTLYGYLSRLRQALASAAVNEAVIARRPGGYVLEVDPVTVDLHRFRDLVAQARLADDERAAVLMERALALWRGEAFATVDTPWFCDLRQVLERERLSAELDSVDIRLRGGLHGELLPGLTTRAREQPLDERVAGQLMLALYRGGRPADALSQYQSLRGRLAEELGIDPAPALQELYRQILVADPRLAAPQAAGAAVVPRQLPAPPPLFTGRESELVRLSKLLTPQGEPDGESVLIAAVCGTGGVGKTWLALRWAHEQQEAFPDGQLYADLRGFAPFGEPVDPYAAMRGFLESLGADPAALPTTPQAQAALYRSLTAGRRLLVVLDNARDTDQVVPLLPGSPTCTVLVTSRHQLLGLTASHGAGQLTLDTLDGADSHDLLVRHLGADRVAAEPDAAAELIRHCAGLPLAISVLAARVTTNPMLGLTALVAEVHDASTRLDALETGEVTSDVRTVFASSYRALDADAARVFRQLAQAPGTDIALPAAAGLTALPPARLRTLLRRLQAYHLVQERVPGRFTCHDLLRAYALELAESAAHAEEAEAALTRVLDHYAHTAYAADRLLLPHRDPLRPAAAADGTRPEEFATHDLALAWFADEHPVLTAAVEHAARTGRHAQAWRLAWAFTTFLARRGRWADVAAVHTTALAAAARTGDTAAQAESHRALAWACTETGRFAEAHRELARALDLSEAGADLLSTAHTHLALGWLYERQGDRSAALRHDELAVDSFTAVGHLAGRARALNAVAWDHAQLGNHAAAVRRCEEALAIQGELGDERGRAGTWDTLGYAYHRLGDHTKAIDCYEQSLGLNRALSHRYNEAETLVHLGQAHRATGAVGPAREALRQALAIYLDIHAPDPEVDEVRALLRELADPA
ncbi:SARP family transcriptional regulator [Streptomyces sp. WAC 01529]|uniref:AfsR/SARP family transcriptional regulator n=1 Tax=Streptomyces sp. WAC 01529 TaxID=2203205 RepID=UPI000F71491F|nr:BTAD domain-containing putative transcriptional regulator [Streptomyces sp. WAC 01529]AZM51287.1 SARP family transcriptional regulator [Streptomyces sp. WAC 01529]